MSYQKLERAANLFGALKELDQEIQEIGKIAMQMADGKMDITFSLSLNKSEPERAGPSPLLYSSRDDLANDLLDYSRGMPGNMFTTNTSNFMFPPGIKPIDLGHCYADSITESTGLQLLGVLMADKRIKRNKLVEEIKEMNLV